MTEAPAASPAQALMSRAGLLTCAFYAACFVAIGAHLPFWPVWLAEWGLTEAEIGSYLGAGLVVRIVVNAVFGALADRYAMRRLMLGTMGLASALVFLLHLAAETKAMLFLLTLLVTTTLSPMIPLGEALGLRAAGRHGFAYAHARAAGSVAFLLSNIGVGWAIAATSADAALWTLAISCTVAGFLGFIHPGGGAPAGAQAAGLDTARLREGLALFAQPGLGWFALAASLAMAAHATYYLYGSIDWARQGISHGTIGQLWAAGVVAETVLMLGPGAVWVARLGAMNALALGAGAGALRWVAMAFEPGLMALWPLQALHALSFGLAHLAIMAFAASHIPPRLAASGQGVLIGLSSGVAMAVATLAAGWLTGLAGLAAAWWMCAAMGIGAALAARAAGRAARAAA